MINRRSVIGGSGAVGVALLAGCLDDLGQDDSGSEPAGGGGSGVTTASSDDGSNCRIETRTDTQRVYDEVETVTAGQTITWNPDLEEGDVLTISVNKLDGARPALSVQDAGGSVIAGIGPEESIRQTITADSDDRYYIQLENEAMLTSGQWDIRIDIEYEYEEEVCN